METEAVRKYRASIPCGDDNIEQPGGVSFRCCYRLSVVVLAAGPISTIRGLKAGSNTKIEAAGVRK